MEIALHLNGNMLFFFKFKKVRPVHNAVLAINNATTFELYHQIYMWTAIMFPS